MNKPCKKKSGEHLPAYSRYSMLTTLEYFKIPGTEFPPAWADRNIIKVRSDDKMQEKAK